MFNVAEFASRRHQLMEAMEPDSIAVFFAAPHYLRNGDAEYSYRPDSDFYYLSGFKEPEAVLVLIPKGEEGEFILFNRPRDPESEQWTGKRLGQEGAEQELGVDRAYPIQELTSKLPVLLSGKKRLFYTLGKHEANDKIVLQALQTVRARARAGVNAPTEIVSVDKMLAEFRLIKSDSEIKAMRHAAQISARAHVRGMERCRPGMYEYQLEAEYMYEFLRGGCHTPAYTSIVGGGENACILHYTENDQVLREGDLVLVDAGGEYNYYAADITRTYPVNGRFTAEQRAIYEVVLAAQYAALEVIRPGERWNIIHETAVKVLTDGLVQIGLLKGNTDSLIEQQAFMPFYMHRTGHWLGIDVHDVGAYKVDGQWRRLEPGMVLTVEPGLYISPGTPNVAEKWWNIGVRIEDDVLVTKTDLDILSKDVPKEINDIEMLMQHE